MKLSRLLVVSLAVLLVSASVSQASQIKINFADNNYNGTPAGWNYIPGTKSAVLNSTTSLFDTNLTPTDITMKVTDAFGYVSSGRGQATQIPDADFPVGVSISYAADNASSGRDSLAILTFLSPNQYTFSYKILSSNNYNNPSSAQGYFNVGGTWVNTATGFSGGSTIILDAAKLQGGQRYDIGQLIGIQSLWDGTQYVTSLQMGMKGTTGVYLNGLIIDIVPEPATMSLLGLGVLGLIRRK